MDPLEEQLVKLSIINSGYSAQNTGEALVSKKPTFARGEELHNDSIRAISPKKVGPLVPPKPHKKTTIFPEIPQSSIVKQICEPLYSQRLQCLEGGSLLKVGRPPILQRKQPIYAGQDNLYNNTSKVTLDNPAVLDQQLEALAHHKKQLEKKRLLLEKQQGHSSNKSPLTLPCIPKLSSTSLISDLRTGGSSSTNIYSNMRKPSMEDNVYKSFSNCENKPENIYSNLVYDKEDIKKTPSQTPSGFSVRAAPVCVTGEYLSEVSTQQDDDLPPPPSPVSSSYSELRRAADVFVKKNPTIKPEPHLATDLEYSCNKIGIDNATGIACEKSMSGNNKQTYINVNYTNEYSNYSPTIHSMSQDSNDYYGYGSFSQGSSNYESIYEPINPRPPSQSSTRSNYIMYLPYVNEQPSNDSGVQVSRNVGRNCGLMGLGGNYSGGSNTPIYVSGATTTGSIAGTTNSNDFNNKSNEKEAEVETLTDYLVNTMDAANEMDNYGVCFKCNERVMGENSGCTAMDQIYHIACFTCSQCQINLQGKPFYALENKPYCEYDYLQTLEKCSVCMKPILERILRATGKPYHPQCFTCVVCNKSLDGIPFTVDATNQNYCIADFHKKFAPRCCVCKEPIMPEPGEEETIRVVALDRSFHFECYKCEDCGLLLSSEAEGRGCYPLDDHVLCKSCNAKRVQMLTNRMTTEL